MKVVAIGGSPRLQGDTNYLIDQVLQELKEKGIETEKFILNQYSISPCQAHDDCGSFTECKVRDDAPAILEKFAEADGIILASPVYMYTISAQMKTFMDRTFFFYTHDRPIKARAAGLIAIGGGAGADETIKEMKKLTRGPGMKVFTLAGYTGSSEARKMPDLIQKARDMGLQMAEVLLTGKKVAKK